MNSIRWIRRQNFGLLVDDVGGQAAMADLLGKDRNQVWQWLIEDETSKQSRAISEKSARHIESATNHHVGWLDVQRGMPAMNIAHRVQEKHESYLPFEQRRLLALYATLTPKRRKALLDLLENGE